ncbi:MAG: PKD domain-containing protein, partial [Flavobacteriales bacterium]|nr:PKD domain-containing protein [Flavobacteriales bacterium]
MNRPLIRCLFFLCVLLLSGTTAQATHLIGGNLGYNYIGETAPGSQVYRYEVYLEFFMNCGPNSNWESFYQLLGQDYGTPLTAGVYLQDPLDPDADKVKLQDALLFITDSTLIEPDLPDNCVIGQGLCTKKGTFVGTVDLPLSFSGYHLYYQICCRNLDIDNLLNPNGTGIGYYAFIPPTLVNNSSPEFLGVPTPFLCTSDTTTFLNSAVDPDGDQLIFSFEVPYDSYVIGGGLIQPPNVLGWPIPNVDYGGGFSLAQPFGAGGYSFINGSTGLTQYLSPLQGNFVVAVEVKEFRNGNLIGRVRRDLQLQVIACPPNETPEAVAPIVTSYSVLAGDQLCFDMNFQDIDGDSLELIADGTIFDGGLFNPPATIGSPVAGLANVSSQFCWDTSCDQGQGQPYLFSVSVTDNGCPPKTIDLVYQVQVIPFTGPQQINGPDQVCANSTAIGYSVAGQSGTQYTWSIIGGNQVSGGTSSSITVDWGGAGAGQVTVFATDSLGCSSAPIQLDVTIVPLPQASAGPDVTICSGSGTVIGGTPSGPPGSSFAWSPATGLSATNVANPTASPANTTSYVLTVTNAGCISSDTLLVQVNSATADAGPDVAICPGDTTQLQASGGVQYVWSPITGLSDPAVADPLAFPLVTTWYTVLVTDTNACIAPDSLLVEVLPLPAVDPGPDTTLCPGDVYVLGGAPTGPAGSTYLWSPTTGLNDPTLPDPTLSVTTAGTYLVTVTAPNGCSDTASVELFVATPPGTDAGPNVVICLGDSIQLQGNGIGSISWTPSGSLSDPTILDPWASPDSTTTYILTIDNGGVCVGTDQVVVTVDPGVNANAGPNQALCQGDTVQLQASGGLTYAWSPPTGLSDASIADPDAFPSVTTTYTVLVTNVNQCTDLDSVTISVAEPVSAGSSTTISTCGSDDPIDLFPLLGPDADAGGTWTPGDVHVPGNGGGTYAYIVLGVAPCPNDTAEVVVLEPDAAEAGPDASICLGDTAQLTATGGIGYSWSPVDGLSDPNGATTLAFPAMTTLYTVTVVDSLGCVTTDSATVNVGLPPNADAGQDTTICLLTDAQLGGNPTGPAGSSYSWAPSA